MCYLWGFSVFKSIEDSLCSFVVFKPVKDPIRSSTEEQRKVIEEPKQPFKFPWDPCCQTEQGGEKDKPVVPREVCDWTQQKEWAFCSLASTVGTFPKIPEYGKDFRWRGNLTAAGCSGSYVYHKVAPNVEHLPCHTSIMSSLSVSDWHKDWNDEGQWGRYEDESSKRNSSLDKHKYCYWVSIKQVTMWTNILFYFLITVKLSDFSLTLAFSEDFPRLLLSMLLTQFQYRSGFTTSKLGLCLNHWEYGARNIYTRMPPTNGNGWCSLLLLHVKKPLVLILR